MSKEIDLECALCKDIYREPKTLECLHSFCLECLETYVERNHTNVELRCPLCRAPFDHQHLDKLSIDSFLLHSLKIHNNSISHYYNQKLMCLDGENEASSYCLDCQDYFCEICTKSHKTMKLSKNHQIILIEEIKEEENQKNSISKSNPQIYCQIHQQKEIELFCDDCRLPICSLCVPQHPSHKVIMLSNIVGNEKQSFINLINKVKPKEKELREGINKCEEVIKQLEINSTTTQNQINELFNKIRIKLDEKEQELLHKLDEIEKYKKKELQLQKDELQFGIESIIGSCQMIENSILLSSQNDVRLLSMKSLYHSRLNYLLNNIWKIEPCHHSFVEFSIGEKEEESIYPIISNIGIIDPNGISPEKSLILRHKSQRMIRDEEFQFEVISYPREGNEIKKGGKRKRFQIQIEKEPNNEDNMNFECEVVDLNNGRYQVKMKIKDEGKYSIFVKYDGMNVSSSPFQIQIFPTFEPRNNNGINQPKLTFGSKGNGNGQFNNPNGIITDVNGNIIVCDSGNHRIQIFDSKGKFISTFESCGDRNVQLDFNNEMFVASNGNIYVCDKDNHRIQIFDSEGKFISKVGSQGSGNGQFNNPNGMVVNSKGNIYVCDQSNHRIQIFNSKGKFISTFGSQGNGNGQFNNPQGMRVGKNDNIYVCDNGNSRIQIFDSDGKLILTFGSNGNGNGQFSNPNGIYIDVNGEIFVRDSYRIQIFDSEGKFISTFGSKGNGNGQFNNPIGITINSKGNIIVCDYNNDRIQIFDSEGKFISTFGSQGSGNGQFNSPNGAYIDKNDNIYVCDSGNHRIQIFDSDGKFISTFGSNGYGNGQFNHPNGIAINLKGNIYICDYGNHRIQIFNSDGKFISTFGSNGYGNGQFNSPRGITVNSIGNIIVCDGGYDGNAKKYNYRVQIFDSEGKFISTFGSYGSGNGQFNNPNGVDYVDLNDNILVSDFGNNRIQIFNSNGTYIAQFKVNQPKNINIDPKTQDIIVYGDDNKISIF